MNKLLVLDKTYVIYNAADEVIELLCLFIREKCKADDTEKIKGIYMTVSLRSMSSIAFQKTALTNRILRMNIYQDFIYLMR